MRLARWLYDNLIEWTVGLILLVITALACMQVFNRYILEAPRTWTEEFAQLLLVWAVMLGAAAGIKRNGHLRVDFLVSRLPQAPRRVLLVLINALVFAVALGMTWYGWMFYQSTSGDYSTSLGYARNLFYLPIPVSGLLIMAFLVPATVAELRTPHEHERPPIE
jgi:TRAP-type C4-dicarboxylate transport system permease small subunit